jgi:signal transduction histidine kinase
MFAFVSHFAILKADRFRRNKFILNFLASTIVAVVLTIATATLWYDYQQADAQVDSITMNLASSLVISVDGAIDAIDIALLDMADEYVNRSENGKLNKTLLIQMLKMEQSRLPVRANLHIALANGDLIDDHDGKQPAINFSDRDYFQLLKNATDKKLVISEPIQNRLSHSWIWLFARRIEKPDGEFLGVVMASIPTDEINDLLEKHFTLPPGGSISLRSPGLLSIARVNFGNRNDTPVGDRHISNAFYAERQKNHTQGSYISDEASADKTRKSYSYVMSKNYGYVILVGIARTVVLSDWRTHLVVTALLVLLFISCTIVFVHFIGRAWRQQELDIRTISESRDALKSLNDELEARVAVRTEQLSGALDHLRATQEDLIQSEKLASLGFMVAGVSHEINTPIGNAVTITSTLREQLSKFDAALHEKSVSRPALIRWHDESVEMVAVLQRSVDRVAELVRNFKQLAVDKTSEQRHQFNLCTEIDNIIVALSLSFSEIQLTIDNAIPKDIECDSYPGPLCQVVDNLIRNAVLHGFEGRKQGRIVLNATLDKNLITLTISDNGKGMDPSVLARIFEPFYTTQLGKGGSGIGLALCHRIATTILGGDLRATSTKGAGSQFILTFMRIAPGSI